MSALRLAMLALAVLVALIAAGPAAAQDCPGRGLLLFDGNVYSELELPADRSVTTAESLGPGRLAFLRDVAEESCDPQSSEVVAVAGVGKAVAVAVAGRTSIFVLGARCAGYEGAARLDCVVAPLEYDGTLYVGTRAARGVGVAADAPLGEGAEGGETRTVVSLEGVDPEVAVGIEGRPDEAFVAAGACPYEYPAPTAADNDLARCLLAPLWFVYELERPPAALPGERVTARADRRVPAVVDGAGVALVRREGTVDVLPADLAGAVPVGTLQVEESGAVALEITVPDVPTGVYEAVLTCERCAGEFGGETVFPAGSLTIASVEEGSSGGQALGIAAGIVFFILLGAAVVAWRRGWWRPMSGRRRTP